MQSSQLISKGGALTCGSDYVMVSAKADMFAVLVQIVIADFALVVHNSAQDGLYIHSGGI